MDPFSAEGELLTIHSAFVAGQYAAVIASDTSSLSPSNALAARLLQLRARIAVGEATAVAAELAGETGAASAPLRAARLLAAWETTKDLALAEEAKAVAAELQGGNHDAIADGNQGVLCAATVLAAAGETEEALRVLGRVEGSLDAVALMIQIHLQQNRTDLAAREAASARKWAQDSLLVNVAESWVGLREGGEKYQAAFYVFEELAQNPHTQSIPALLGQAVTELHLGRLPEAEAALDQARALDSDHPDVLANLIVLHDLLGHDAAPLRTRLEQVAPEHELIRGLREKRSLFEEASRKYTPKFEVA